MLFLFIAQCNEMKISTLIKTSALILGYMLRQNFVAAHNFEVVYTCSPLINVPSTVHINHLVLCESELICRREIISAQDLLPKNIILQLPAVEQTNIVSSLQYKRASTGAAQEQNTPIKQSYLRDSSNKCIAQYKFTYSQIITPCYKVSYLAHNRCKTDEKTQVRT